MSLLEDIQAAAVDSKSDLGTLLRMCKLLAARLGSQPLEDWLLWESNGYPDEVIVPDYRIWPVQLKGHFFGPFGSGIQNAPIPISLIPETVRDSYQNFRCRQSVAGIEETLSKNTGGVVQVSTGDLAFFLGDKVYQDQHCVQSWGEVSTGRLVELLNAVRNRILDFTLKVWKLAPDAGDNPKLSLGVIDSTKVSQIFHMTVYGSANVVGTAENSIITLNVTTKDFTSLEKVLRENGIGQEDVTELQAAITSDPEPREKGRFGPRVSAWMGKMVQKAANGGWDIAIQAAGNLLANSIAKYYGLQ